MAHPGLAEARKSLVFDELYIVIQPIGAAWKVQAS